ncbi:hypothetical protein AHAS_Ahas13G0292600 [Arachis hypogaea]
MLTDGLDYINGRMTLQMRLLSNCRWSNQWGYTSENNQDNSIRYCPPSQDDSGHYTNGGWEYQQGMKEYEHLPEPQDDSYCYNNHLYCDWEGQNQRNLDDPYFVHQETSSLERAFNNFMQNCSPMPQDNPHSDEFYNNSHCGWEDQNQKAFDSSYSTYQEPSTLEQTFNSFMLNCPTSPPKQCLQSAIDSRERTRELLERQEQSWKEQETLFKKMDGHLEQMRRTLELLSKEDEDQLVDVKEEVEEQEEEAPVSSKNLMKNEVVEVFEPETAHLQKPLEMTREHENSQLPQISLNQRLSTLESVIERYEEEMKKSWEEQQTSSMKILLHQMLSAKEEVEEQENEEDNQGSPYSS